MRYIYEQADEVFGWLGLPCDGDKTYLAVQMMRNCRQRVDDEAKANNNQSIIVSSIKISEDDDIFPKLGTKRHEAWLGVRDVLRDRPYWERTWIYQEATGRTLAYYFCGNCYFDKRDLRATIVVSD